MRFWPRSLGTQLRRFGPIIGITALSKPDPSSCTSEGQLTTILQKCNVKPEYIAGLRRFGASTIEGLMSLQGGKLSLEPPGSHRARRAFMI